MTLLKCSRSESGGSFHRVNHYSFFHSQNVPSTSKVLAVVKRDKIINLLLASLSKKRYNFFMSSSVHLDDFDKIFLKKHFEQKLDRIIELLEEQSANSKK